MRCIILNRFYMLKMFVREFVCIPLEHRTMAGQKVALINIEHRHKQIKVISQLYGQSIGWYFYFIFDYSFNFIEVLIN